MRGFELWIRILSGAIGRLSWEMLGEVFEVLRVDAKTGLLLKNNCWYPYFVLEKVEKPALLKGRTVADFSDGDLRVMVWNANGYRVFMLADLRVIPE